MPKIKVFFLPKKSEKIPVGTSKIEEEINTREKMLVPSAKEPEICEK